MGESNRQTQATRHKEVVGVVTSNRMSKTIVVKVTRTRSHGFYGRVVSKDKKFYAHDEGNTAHIGDFVRLEETRPLSRLKRWRLKEIIRKAALAPEALANVDEAPAARS